MGDIVARPGRAVVSKILPSLREELKVDLVFANAENLAGGRGATSETLLDMLNSGVDYFTSGHHIFDQEDFEKTLTDPDLRILRPANYPEDIPGKGFTLISDSSGGKVLLVNLLGNVFTRCNTACPFRCIENILKQFSDESLEAIFVDFHAEVTSEKRAMGFFLDGKVSAMVGTHTHVPTADAQILPKGTAYVTDIGMVGAKDSVIGVKSEIIIDYLKYPYPRSFEWEKRGRIDFQSVLLKINDKGRATKIERWDKVLEF